jgi:glycyl-tRNA synthetase (class II)
MTTTNLFPAARFRQLSLIVKNADSFFRAAEIYDGLQAVYDYGQWEVS